MATVLVNGRRNGSGSRLAVPSATAVVNVAIYARVSTTERLGQEFNSLDNQQAMCEAYVASQAGAGWQALPDLYHDGGFTGANTERPALRRLLADVESGRVNLVLVYRLDRLTRSMRDFIRMVEVFERRGVAFASVSESFNTTTPVGRMTMHVLLSFSQFEREVTSERTKDKIRGAKQRGKWCGGCPVFGFDITGGKLVPNEVETHRVRQAFAIYLDTGSLIATAGEMNRRGWTTKSSVGRDGRARGNRPWNKGVLHGLLTNPTVVGKVTSAGHAYRGEHEAIVDQATWDATQARLQANAVEGSSGERHRGDALLAGLLKCAHCGSAMTPSSARSGPRVYRYYRCSKQVKQGRAACPAKHVNAAKVEGEVVKRIAEMAGDERVIAAVVEAAREALAATKKSLADEARAIRRSLKDAERERGRLSTENAPVGHVDALGARINDLRARADEITAERAALDATAVEPSEIAALLAGSFEEVWGAMTSRERRRTAELLVDRVVFSGTEPVIALRAVAPAHV